MANEKKRAEAGGRSPLREVLNPISIGEGGGDSYKEVIYRLTPKKAISFRAKEKKGRGEM